MAKLGPGSVAIAFGKVVSSTLVGSLVAVFGFGNLGNKNNKHVKHSPKHVYDKGCTSGIGAGFWPLSAGKKTPEVAALWKT